MPYDRRVEGAEAMNAENTEPQSRWISIFEAGYSVLREACRRQSRLVALADASDPGAVDFQDATPPDIVTCSD